jgi:hypothetical protein
MKNLLLLLLLFASNVSFGQADRRVLLFSYFKGNGEDGLHLATSDDGYTWTALRHDSSFLKPTVGKEKLMRDPCIIRTPGPNGMFHMVWTTGWNEKGIGYASSKDLIHWSDQIYIPVMEHERNARNCWAPEIFYEPNTKRFVIYWATTIDGRFPETKSDKEDSYNHRIYYVTTNDFKNFSKAKLLYNSGFNAIDATIVTDAKNYIMFVKDETVQPPQKNIRIATSKRLTEGYSNPGKPITGNYWAEGPTATHLNGQWIVYFDKYVDHKMGAVRSKDLKSWEDISDQVKFPEGVRHGSVLQLIYSGNSPVPGK